MFDKWDHRFMEMAQLVSTWASCYQQERKVGAVIVKDKRVMTHRLQRCAVRREDLRGARRVPAQKAGHSLRHAP